jgi:hypothetical protein
MKIKENSCSQNQNTSWILRRKSSIECVFFESRSFFLVVFLSICLEKWISFSNWFSLKMNHHSSWNSHSGWEFCFSCLGVAFDAKHFWLSLIYYSFVCWLFFQRKNSSHLISKGTCLVFVLDWIFHQKYCFYLCLKLLAKSVHEREMFSLS